MPPHRVNFHAVMARGGTKISSERVAEPLAPNAGYVRLNDSGDRVVLDGLDNYHRAGVGGQGFVHH